MPLSATAGHTWPWSTISTLWAESATAPMGLPPDCASTLWPSDCLICSRHGIDQPRVVVERWPGGAPPRCGQPPFRLPAGQRAQNAGATCSRAAPAHSGAGRIVSLRMRPMSLCRAGPVGADGQPCRPTFRYPTGHRGDVAGHGQRLHQRDLPVGLSWPPVAVRAGPSPASQTTIAAASGPGDSTPSRDTILGYRSVLESLYLLDQVPGWVPPRTTSPSLGPHRNTTWLTRRSRRACSASTRQR